MVLSYVLKYVHKTIKNYRYTKNSMNRKDIKAFHYIFFHATYSVHTMVTLVSMQQISSQTQFEFSKGLLRF